MIEDIGENKEFTVHSISDVTVNIGTTGYTSANDTELVKYFDRRMTPISSASKFNIRTNQTVEIVSINGTTLTDPITVIINKGHTEEFDYPMIYKMVIRTTVADTLIRLRIK
jgi:hypothetical protein